MCIALLTGLSVLLSACSHQAKKSKKKHAQIVQATFASPTTQQAKMIDDLQVNPTADRQPIDIHEYQARLVDISLPLGIIPRQAFTYNDADKITLHYEYKTRDFAQVALLFEGEMECNGWRHIATFVGDELLMTFHKPHRFCTVVGRTSGQRGVVELILYLGSLG